MNYQMDHISKNKGGKHISNWHNSLMTSSSKSSDTWGSITFSHMTLKKILKHARIPITKAGKMAQIVVGKSYCINTWQSCDFKPTNFKSYIKQGY